MCQDNLVCEDNLCVDANMGTNGGTGDGDGDTGPGDGDGDTGPGDGDGDTGPGDGDGDTGPGDGDGDTGPAGDLDNDGVDDNEDNCPNDPNPNQLDFDGNGAGNVCDDLTFTNVSGLLDTTINFSNFGSCSTPVAWSVTDGEVRMRLDDDAAVVQVEITSLDLANFSGNCDLAFAMSFAFNNPNIILQGGGFPVQVPHNLTSHENGTITGVTNGPHPMLFLAEGNLEMQGQANVSPIEFMGNYPTITANIMNGGATGTLTWAVANTAVTDLESFSITDPFPADISVRFTGLVGSLMLSP